MVGVTAVQNDRPTLSTVTSARRAEITVDNVGLSFWTAVTPVIAVLVILVLLRDRRARAFVPPGTPVRAGVLAALAAGLIGMAVNDSGVIVVAMVLVVVGPCLALLALADPPAPRPVLLEPAESPSGHAARTVSR